MPRSFYARPVLTVARALIGRLLVHEVRGRRVSGRIVEVEAYRGADDPASHAFRGPTPRNRIMFAEAGHAYIYFTYGMHHCLNVVTGPTGDASAVLIRALEPVEGIDRMQRRRGLAGAKAFTRLARGPGCVAQALGLDRHHDGLDFTRGPLWIDAGEPEHSGYRVVRGPRIGIRLATDRPWRFFLEGHPCVSARRTVAPTRDRSVVVAGRP